MCNKNQNFDEKVKIEHNPPHIHALYQNKKAIYDIRTGEETDGNFPIILIL